MCTRFVYNGDDMITGFNFDIDFAVWDHKVITERERFYIGIRMPDHRYHSFHGVNANGNAGTLLYVHGNEKGQYCGGDQCCSIADLTEAFVRAEISLDDALDIVRSRNIVYAPDATMQSMLSDKSGRVLMIEPGIGYRLEKERYSLVTNYSLLMPEETRPYIVTGDDRYERAAELLESFGSSFSAADAMSVLESVRQEGVWATRVTFVYSVKEQKVYYVLNNNFDRILEYQFH